MVSAEKARKVADSKNKSTTENELEKINSLIIEHSEKGLYSVSYKIKDNIDVASIQRIMEENGYHVVVFTTRDCDCLMDITWRGEENDD